MEFPTSYTDILARVDKINPRKYASSRNHLNGAVSYLSPYFTHGVINTKQVALSILSKFKYSNCEKYIFELAWREYWHSVWNNQGSKIFTDLKTAQTNVDSNLMPQSILNASTGLLTIDECITELYNTGYMHNHARMWVASLTCNIAHTYWLNPAKWLYYHLLDGDLASNTLSWQWIAGTFSHKKYLANQDNLNKFSGKNQTATFLDLSYEQVAQILTPEELSARKEFIPESVVYPNLTVSSVKSENVLLYHPWNLNPEWDKNEVAERILVIDPAWFNEFAISQKRLDFILKLAKNIPDIQIHVGNVNDIKGLSKAKVKYTQYPLVKDFPGEAIPREFMFLDLQNTYFSSFTKFWEQAQKQLPNLISSAEKSQYHTTI